jgi:glucose-1-phosphatase
LPVIDQIIFDMDGVLCRTDFARRLTVLGDITGLEPRAVDAAIFQSGFDDLADRGHYSAAEYLELFAAHLGVPVSREEWLAARRAAMTPDHDMLALAKRLQRRVPVAMLTNNGPLLQEGLAEVFPQAVALFGDHAYFSCQFRSTKEEPAIFHAISQTLGARVENTLFIDDSEVYIASAQSAGLATHQYMGIDGLMSFMRQIGLSPD